MSKVTTTAEPAATLSLPQSISSTLNRLRRRVRWYVLVEGLAVTLAALGLAFWISLAIDWGFEPSVTTRVAVLVVAAVSLAYVVYRWLIRRGTVRLRPRSMAVLLESRFQDFGDGLLTSVELSEPGHQRDPYSPEMLDETRRRAAGQVGGVNVNAVFNPLPLAGNVVAAVLLVGSVAAFAYESPDAFGTWYNRSIMLSQEPWPRMTSLVVEGFNDDDIAVVAEGTSFTMKVRAYSEAELPRDVTVEYVTADGTRDERKMDRLDEEGATDYRNFELTFDSVMTDMWIAVEGGDRRVDGYRVEVVPHPAINSMVLACDYPRYTGRLPQSLVPRNLTPLPVGTEIVVRGLANKDLERIEVYDLAGDTPEAPLAVLQWGSGLVDPRYFELDLGRLTRERQLQFKLLDGDGFTSPEPTLLEIAAKEDEPPLVTVRREGIGTSVTAKARIPLVGEITDDYGVAHSWIEFAVDDGDPGRLPFVFGERVEDPVLAGTSTDGVELFTAELEVEKALEIAEMGPAAGQTVMLFIKAQDTYENGPNVGSGEPFLLNVVTDEQLHAILEGRELTLRHRFERIVRDMMDARTSLGKLAFEEEPAEPADDAEEPAGDETGEGEAEEPAEEAAEGAEEEAASEEADESPEATGEEEAEEEKEEEGEQLSPEEVRAAQNILIQRALQTSRRSADETLGIALSFLSIREELINNRIDSEHHKERLKERIADPLKQIAEEMFPRVDVHLEDLQVHLDDPETAERDLAQALVEADAILDRMHAILAEMKEQEGFNEILAQFRMLHERQRTVTQQTREQKNEILRSLKDLQGLK